MTDMRCTAGAMGAAAAESSGASVPGGVRAGLWVAIRVDASTAIGSGHVMRCLTLAGRLRAGGAEVSFIMRELPGNLVALARAQGYTVYTMPAREHTGPLVGYEEWLTVPVEADAREVLELVRAQLGTVDRIVTDSYALDYRWEQVLRSVTGEIMVIDDLANRRHDCDILLDQNFYLDKDTRYAALVPAGCELLLGPEHALLREEFYTAREHRRERDGQLRHVLVFYGGSDLTDETTKAIHALVALREGRDAQGAAGTTADVGGAAELPRHQPYDFTVTVVVGLSNARREAVRELCARYDYITYLCQVDNMAELMTECDLMLGAGGTTTWERLFLGVPAIVTAIAENQLRGCEDCAAAGLIDYLGRAETVTPATIATHIRERYRSKHLAGNCEKSTSKSI